MVDGIITINVDGNVTGWNAAATSLFAYERAEILGQSMSRIIPDLTTQACMQPLKLNSDGNPEPSECFSRELMGVKKNGSLFPIDLMVSHFFDSNQERFFTVIVRDVSERRKVENALRESEERSRATFDQAAVGISHIKLDGTFLRINQRFCEITGYQSHELTRMTFQDITYPDDLDRDMDLLARLLAGSIPTYTMDKRYITKDLGIIWITLTVSLVRSADGEPKYFISVVQDISARKEAEDKLRRLRDELEERVAQRTKSLEDESIYRAKIQENLQRKEAELRLITKIIPATVLYIDNQLRYRFCNDLYARWWKKPQEAIIGRYLPDIVGKEFFEAISPYVTSILETGEPVTFEKSLSYADQSRYIRGDMLPDKDANGAVRGFVVLATDITSQHCLQEELRRAKESADSANQAKSSFLATMSHEIRTPIGVILGYSEELLKASVTEADRIRLAETILRNGKNLLAIVNDVLDLSKVEIGKLDTEKSSFSLPSFMADVISQMRIKASEKSLCLTWAIGSPIPETIETDITRLRQILFNLIGNAIKFTDTGNVVVKVSLVDGDDGKKIQFLVNDTGVGIDEKNQGHLFQPFTQADSSVARKHGGTGLGLSLSRQLARLLGGDVSLLNSQVAEGSSFAAWIDPGPLANATYVSAVNPAEIEFHRTEMNRQHLTVKVDLSGMRILVVEDFEDNLMLLRSILEDAAAEVFVADNGQKGFEMAMASPYDAVLMDMQMPIRDGYWATIQLRTHGYTKPIIALTAHAMLGEKERCLRIGCTDFLTKPVDRLALLKTLSGLRKKNASAPEREAMRRQAVASGDEVVPDRDGPLYSSFIDQPVVARILPVFVRKLPEKMAALQNMYEAADFDGVKRLAHQLKGAGGTYGFPDITRYAHIVEQAKAGDGSMTVALEALGKLCERIVAGLDSMAVTTRVSSSPHSERSDA